MSAASLIIERLDRVRPSAPGRWMARCPAHQDRTASLSVRELDDGRVLLHCFGGCETGAVLGALGLRLADLFERPLDTAGATRDRGHWHGVRAALQALRDESRVVVLTACDVADGRALSPSDAQRVAEAAGRISRSIEALYGQ